MIATNAEQEQYYIDEAEAIRIEEFSKKLLADGWTKMGDLFYKDEVNIITQADMDEFAESQWVDPMEIEEVLI